MFYLALLLLILLGAVALIIVVQNFETLFAAVHLAFLSWSLPGIPVLLLCLIGAFLGGLVLYVFASHSARRDAKEFKLLRARIEDLEQEQKKAPSGSLAANFAPPVVPLPGFAPGGSSGSAGPAAPAGPSGPPGFSGPAGSPGSSGLLGKRQQPPSSLQNISPSASGSNLSLPPRAFPAPPQTGAPRPPFPGS